MDLLEREKYRKSDWSHLEKILFTKINTGRERKRHSMLMDFVSEQCLETIKAKCTARQNIKRTV